MKYYSQYKQDKFVNQILRKTDGIFLDIGANDGMTLSNSYFFEKNLNWKGICIEPIDEIFQKLLSNRNCICLNCGVWSQTTELQFYRAKGYSEMLSGIIESFNNEHFIRLQKEIKEFGGKVETVKINVRSLNEILIENSIYNIDFCSIDTEGSEFEILSALDFEKFKIKMIVVENQYDELKLRGLLREKGYKLIKRLGGDDVFIKNELSKNISIKINILFYQIQEWIENLKMKFTIYKN
jgi:FkbM family methyltransferase